MSPTSRSRKRKRHGFVLQRIALAPESRGGAVLITTGAYPVINVFSDTIYELAAVAFAVAGDVVLSVSANGKLLVGHGW